MTLTFPRPHTGQKRLLNERSRFNVVACGRRFGKTKFAEFELAAKTALDGHPFGWFAPNYKYLLEPFDELRRVLAPVISKANATDRRIELVTGGVIDFWTLEDRDSGRGRKYKRVAVDEAGFANDLAISWEMAIMPTLTDLRGEAWFLGTPKGRNYFHSIFALGGDPLEAEWQSWQMPTSANPHIPADEIEKARLRLPERVFRQEYEAQFLEDSGGVFLGVNNCIGARVASAEPVDGESYRLGWDIAKTQDFSVVTVLDSQNRQVYFDRFNGVGWDIQLSRVAAVAAKYGARCTVDSSGVGDPIYDRLRQMLPGLTVTGFKFTASSKDQLISNLALMIEQRQIELMDIPVQTNELLAYEYTITKGGNITSSAPTGMHDDTVMALALAANSSHKSFFVL